MTTAEKKRKEIPPLLSPPLIESIFEIRWELQKDPQTGRYRDPSYPMMYGRLYERLKKEFPLIEDLPSSQVHPEASPYVVRHRLRKEKDGYPLLQIGPGIATANEAKNYSWTSLSKTALLLVESVTELFPKEAFPLNFIRSELRYLNVIEIDPLGENPASFLANKLHTKVEIDSEIHSENQIEKDPTALNLQVVYPLAHPVGNLVLSASLGQMEGKPAFFVQTIIDSLGETVPHNREAFSTWLQRAHEVAENCFLSLCKGDLLRRFCSVPSKNVILK